MHIKLLTGHITFSPFSNQELVNLINSSQVTVISGETGCGKTTQVTQFILDDYIERGKGSSCRIICTQPRRISAISVSIIKIQLHSDNNQIHKYVDFYGI